MGGSLDEGVVGDHIWGGSVLAHVVVSVQRKRAVAALYANVHERRVRVHVALYVPHAHLVRQIHRAVHVLCHRVHGLQVSCTGPSQREKT